MENVTITKPKESVPKIVVNKDILKEAKRQSEVEKQVIVHCSYYPGFYASKMRIWKSTYLRDKDSSQKSRLLNAYNISFFPVWKPIEGRKAAKFTLVFSALPKRCKLFDLFEDIPELGGFYSLPVERNKSDVYFIDIYS